MAESRDPAIKLFGKTIPLSEGGEKSDPASSVPGASHAEDKDTCEDASHTEVESQRSDPTEVPNDPDCSASLNNAEEDNDQDLAYEKKSRVDSKLEEDQTTTNAPGQEKALKKPDKILPCPRCNSLDTKFCYYNNYNVNQPRHFCKNCQRYWTAGGTMRNVPVGAGRRKNKHVASHYRHIVMSSNGLPNTRVDSSEVSHHQVLPCSGLPAPLGPLKGNGTVLKFGPDAPLCESMATVLNLDEHKRSSETVLMTCGDSGEESSSQSSVAASACLDKELPKHTGPMEPGPIPGICNGVMPPPPVPCYGGPPWPFAWSPIWNGVAAMTSGQCPSDPTSRQDANNSNSVQWGLPPMMAPPAFCAPSVPFPFVPAPASYWGCMPGWAGGPWSLPWIPPNSGVSPSSSSNSGCSSNGSPTLGKHSRDGNLPVEKAEKFLWVPKTLRIDDPDEAAKSSIWATLGIKPDTNEPIIKGGIFKAFRPNVEGQDRASDASQLLQANPAALSRSQTFQENTA